MVSYLHSTLFFLLIFISSPIWAAADYWQCAAHDDEKKQWLAISAYQRVATHKAFEACKKESRIPASCKTTNESCEPPENVDNNKQGWQCTALDLAAKAWASKVHSSKDDAALDAKAYCQEHSSTPDSCYINLLTCQRSP